MPEAIATLLKGNAEALAGFTVAEAVQLIDYLQRLIVNLNQISSDDKSVD